MIASIHSAIEILWDLVLVTIVCSFLGVPKMIKQMIRSSAPPAPPKPPDPPRHKIWDDVIVLEEGDEINGQEDLGLHVGTVQDVYWQDEGGSAGWWYAIALSTGLPIFAEETTVFHWEPVEQHIFVTEREDG